MRSLRFLLGLLAAGLITVGCSGGPSAGEPSSSGVPTTVDLGTEPDELAFVDGVVDPVRLGLIRSDSVDPATVNPADQSAIIYVDLVYDGLVEAVEAEGVLRGGLAQSWSSDAEFTSWTFELDPERNVTADEVVASFGRLDQADVSGAVRLVLDEIAAVQAVGKGEVRFDLDRSNAGFPWLLSGVAFSIVGDGESTTGRYQVIVDDETTMVLAAVDGDLPTVEISWVEDASAAYDLMVLGRVDAAVTDRDGATDARRRFGAEFGDRSISSFLVLSRAEPAFGTVAERRAIVGAIGRDDLVDGAYATAVAAADQIVPETVAGFDPSACGLDCSGQGDVDPGIEAGEAGTVVVSWGIEGHEDLAERTAQDLRSAGYRAVAEEAELDELAELIVGDEAEIFTFGWAAVAGSVDAIVPYLLAPDSPANVARLDLAELDALLDEARVTADDEARWALYRQAHDLAMSEYLVVPVASMQSALARAPHLNSLVVRADGSLDMVAFSR